MQCGVIKISNRRKRTTKEVVVVCGCGGVRENRHAVWRIVIEEEEEE